MSKILFKRIQSGFNSDVQTATQLSILQITDSMRGHKVNYQHLSAVKGMKTALDIFLKY